MYSQEFVHFFLGCFIVQLFIILIIRLISVRLVVMLECSCLTLVIFDLFVFNDCLKFCQYYWFSFPTDSTFWFHWVSLFILSICSNIYPSFCSLWIQFTVIENKGVGLALIWDLASFWWKHFFSCIFLSV